jgi:hypothetical protein
MCIPPEPRRNELPAAANERQGSCYTKNILKGVAHALPVVRPLPKKTYTEPQLCLALSFVTFLLEIVSG